jgi:two-component system NarL family sensor kinase
LHITSYMQNKLIKYDNRYDTRFVIIFLLLWLSPSAVAAQPGAVQLPGYNEHGEQAKDTVYISKQIKKADAFKRTLSDSAIVIYNVSLKLSERAGYNRGIAHSLLGLFKCYTYRADPRRADPYLRKAKPYCTAHNDLYLEGCWYQAEGLGYACSGAKDSAIGSLVLALDYAKKADSKYLQIIVYATFGFTYSSADQHDNAIYYLLKAEHLAYSEDSSKQLAGVYLNLAISYGRNGHPGDSIKKLDYGLKALRCARKDADTATIRSALVFLGNYYIEHDRLHEALACYYEGLPLIDKTNPANGFAFLSGLSMVYYLQHDLRQAVIYGEQALALTKKSGWLSPGNVSVYKHMSKVYFDSGKYRNGYLLLETYTQLKDSLDNKQRKALLDELNIKYKTLEREKELVLQKGMVKEKNLLFLAALIVIIMLAVILILFFLWSGSKRNIQADKLRQLQQEQEHKRLRAQMQGEENERLRISRELHDGVASLISGARMQLSILDLGKSGADLNSISIYENGLQLLKDAYDELRQTAHNLSPNKLTDVGIMDALNQYCWRMSLPGSFEVEYQHFGAPLVLDEDQSVAVYRIVQELLHNIQKHAAATHVVVQTGVGEMPCWFLTLEDNGTRLYEEPVNNDGRGKLNIAQRIEACGGIMDIDSRAGTGTTVYIRFNET